MLKKPDLQSKDISCLLEIKYFSAVLWKSSIPVLCFVRLGHTSEPLEKLSLCAFLHWQYWLTYIYLS